MPTPEQHALLSASSSERWLHCTRAPRLEEQLPESTSTYAEEGRLAHAIAELKALKKYTVLKPSTYTRRLNKLKKDSLYTTEMDRHTDTYIDVLNEIAMNYDSRPHVAVEQRLDFSQFVPEGFGTGDCVMIGGNKLNIIDLKYGKGVPVSAEHNPQMMLYALGALSVYSLLYQIDTICMTIVQPRLDSVSSWEISRDDLLNWAAFTVRPKAQQAFAGEGDFAPGDWCRFCRAKANCRARADQYSAVMDFVDEHPIPAGLLSTAEIGHLLNETRGLKAWLADLEEHALNLVLTGEDVPGWKAVEGRSTRAFTDQAAAFAAIQQAGIDEAMLYERRPLTLSAIEKMMGKAQFAEVVGSYVIKPQGKPTLAPETDKREPFGQSAAARDFSE